LNSLPPPDPDALEHSARLAALIREEIAAAPGGAIPFSRFMELCLYAPGLGYYSAGAHKFGGGGDFVTAPELGPLFAACGPSWRSTGASASARRRSCSSSAAAAVPSPKPRSNACWRRTRCPTATRSWSPAPIYASASNSACASTSIRCCSTWWNGWTRRRSAPGTACCSPTR
jgi:hypothetical protein